MKKLLSFLILAAAAFSYAGAQEVDPDLNSTTLEISNTAKNRATVVGDILRDMNVWYKAIGISVESSDVTYEASLEGNIKLDVIGSGSTSCTIYKTVITAEDRIVDSKVISIGNTTAPWIAYFEREATSSRKAEVDGFYSYYDEDPEVVKAYCHACYELDSALSSPKLDPANGKVPTSNGTYYKVMTLSEWATYVNKGTLKYYYVPDTDEDPNGVPGWQEITPDDVYKYYDEELDEDVYMFNPDSIYVVCRYYYAKKSAVSVTKRWETYILDGVEYKETDVYQNTWTEEIHPTTVPSGLDWRNSTSVKFDEWVENVPENAFAGSKIAKFVVDGGDHFSVRGDNDEALYDYDETTLYALSVKAKEGEVEIPLTCNKILNYAMSLAHDCTIISYNPELQVDTMKLGGVNNHVKWPKVNLDYTVRDLPLAISLLRESTKANSAKGIVVESASLTTANVNNLLNAVAASADAAGVCYIDFSSCVTSLNLGTITLPAAINSNCLLYFGSGITVSGTNVVVGESCSTLSLTRDTYKPFFNIYDFTAATATISGLPLSENYTMLCVPFKLEGQVTINGKRTDILSAVRGASLSAYDAAKNEMTYTILTTGGLSANKPYLVCSESGNEITAITCTKVPVAITEDDELSTPAPDRSGVTFGGTFQSVCGDYVNYNFYGMKSNRFAKAKDNASFKPFSAYVYTANKDLSEASIRFVFPDDEEETGVTFDEDVTGVESAAEVAKVVVSLGDGSITVSTSSRTNVNVVSATGAVVFNGEVAGTKDFNVGKGIYIINGKKYIVK